MQGAPGSRPRGRMVSLGRVTAPKPVNLPSQKRENNGNDPNIPLVPKTVTSSVWGSQASQGEAPPPAQGPPQRVPPPAQPAQGQPAGSAWGGAVGSDRRQASALLAQDEFPTLGAPVAETLPNGAPYGHGPQGYTNGVPPSHPPMERAAWDGPSHGPPYGKTGSPANFHYGSWGAPTGERWADSAPPRGPPPAPAYGGASAQYGAMDARMDMQGPPYMPAHGGGYVPFNQPPPPPPRTRPPSAPSDPSGPRYMGAPPEHPSTPQGQHTGGPAAHGHGHGHGPGQYEGHGQIGAASMGGTGYMPPHLRNRDRAEGGMPRPGSEWSIAAQASESLTDEVPPQATPPKILRRDVPTAQHSAPHPGAPPNPQQQHGQHHRGEGHHRSSHADLAPMHPPPLQQQQQQQPFAHQHPHQPRSQAPQGPGQGHAASQPPRVTAPHQQPPPPQLQQQQQPAMQRLQFGQLGSPPGYSRDEGRQPPLPADLHLPNGHLSTPPSGPVAKLQHQHSTGGQGFSPKVAQQLGLGRQESAQDGPGRANGQAAQANGPIMTFGQPTPKVQHQPVAASSRMASAQEAAVPGRAAGGQFAALSELEAQKMFMRQKVQQRQQEVKMQQQQQQQQAPTGQRSGSEASRRSMPQSAAQQAHGDHAEHALPGPSGPGRGHPGQSAGRSGRGHDGGRGQDASRGRGRRDVQRPRSSEAQPLEKALPASSSMPPSEQLIMEAKMRSISLETHKAPPHSGPPHQRHQPHPHQQQHHQQARGETEAALAGPEGSHRRGSASRDSQPKAVPIVTGPRDSGGRREAPGASQQRRPAVPIALPQPDARRGQAECKQPPLEGPLPPEREQRERGARREKRMSDRPPASADAAPSDAAQDAGDSRRSEQAAAAAAAGGSGLPGANRRGSRGERQRPLRGERPGGSANQEAAPQAVDAPPGLGAKQQEPARPAAKDHSAEQGDADGPTGERRERHERPQRSARRERGQRERLPRPIVAAVIDSDAATDGKGSEPADGETGQGSVREPRRRAGERAAKKPRAGGDAAAGQQIQAPPGLGPGTQNGLPERAPGQGSRKERAERELYHPPVKEATESTQEAHAEGSSEQPPLQMTDGKPPGLGRSSRARYGRDRRDRRRPSDGAPEKADGEHATVVAFQDDGEQPQGAAQGESQAEEGARPRQHRGQGSRGPGRGGGGRGRGREATTAPGEGGQEGNANAEGKEEAGDGEGLPQRSSRSGRGRGPRGDGRGRGAKGGASADAGEAGGSDRDASKVRTLEVARGDVDAKGKRAWMVKDGAGGSQAAAENSSKPPAEGAAPASSSSA